MATVIKGKVTESTDATYFKVFDKTSVYNSSTNPNGWFPPNYDLIDVTSGQLIISPADSRTLLPGNPLTAIDVRPTLPNVIGTSFTVMAAATVNTEKFIDGIYEFQLIYGGSWGQNLLQWRYRVAFIAQACCCIEALKNTVLQKGCDCHSAPYLDYVRGTLAIEAVSADYGCFKQERTVLAIKELRDICRRNPCDSCH